MKEIENLKNSILCDYPRLSRESTFTFKCHPGVPCYNDCCHDVNIFLTPYDILRLKKNLGITSGEFLAKYTISPFDENLKYPVVLLQMNDDEGKSCPFVGPKGCGVYADRPWACRMYPLGMASPGENQQALDREFYFLLQENVCKGFGEKCEWTVDGWLADQGIDEYNKMGEYFKELTLNKYFVEGNNLPPQKTEMFFTACYNLDKFRDFLFGSTFFSKIEIDDDTKNKIQNDDLELLRFGHRWLRFVIFGEKTMAIRQDVLEAEMKRMERSGDKT
jgi:Fe-S-cluster containining protein